MADTTLDASASAGGSTLDVSALLSEATADAQSVAESLRGNVGANVFIDAGNMCIVDNETFSLRQYKYAAKWAWSSGVLVRPL